MNKAIFHTRNLTLSACLLMASVAHAQTAPPPPEEPVLNVKPADSEQVIQEVSSLEDEMIGGIDWENNLVYAVGDGVPPTNAVSPAQARVRAKRAAIDEAMARLLEATKEVRVDAESTTRNYINENRLVNTRVSGLVRHAEITELRQAEDGSYQIMMRMPIHGEQGMSGALLPMAMANIQKVGIATRVVRDDAKFGSAPRKTRPVETVVSTSKTTEATAAPEEASMAYTSLIVDASGKEAAPAMYPRILNKHGEVLYDLSRVDPNAAVINGMCAYRKSLDKAKSEKRAGNNPLVIKALETSGSGRADLVLDDADAEKLLIADADGNFLHQANVIVVTD